MQILFVPSGGITPVDQLSPANTLQRCIKALQLWQNGTYHILILSGGICDPPSIQRTAGAEIMRRWFVERGVPEKRIITESHSRDTYENIILSVRLLKNLVPHNQTHHWTVVSQWQRCLRIWITLWRLHRIRPKLQMLRYPIGIRGFLKECVFIAYHLYDRDGNKYLARKNRSRRSFAS